MSESEVVVWPRGSHRSGCLPVVDAHGNASLKRSSHILHNYAFLKHLCAYCLAFTANSPAWVRMERGMAGATL